MKFSTHLSIVAILYNFTTHFVFAAPYNRITGTNVTGYWMETGFQSVNDLTWVSASTYSTSFSSPIVLVSLPDIPGKNSSSGYPSSVRLNSITTTAGAVSFQMKVFLYSINYYY